MKVVLDSNILFRILISGDELINLLFDKDLELFAPERLREEFVNNKLEILSKSKLSEDEFNELASIIFEIIRFVPLDKYKEFLVKAKELLKEHVKDIEFVALALKLNCLVWTYESLFFDVNLGISTKELSTKLNKFKL
ncbi:MAG: PIN domain-containing protein [Nanoarchaeota archaeon]